MSDTVNQILRLASDVDGTTQKMVTPALFSDLLVFQSALHSFVVYMENISANQNAIEHLKEGFRLYRYYRLEYAEGYPILKDLAEKLTLGAFYDRAIKAPSDLETQIKIRQEFLDKFLSRVRGHIPELRDVFQTRAYKTFAGLIQACEKGTPLEIIKSCDAIPPASKNRLVWKWIDECRTIIGGSTTVEKTIATLQTATDLGRELAQVNTQLTSQVPGTEAYDVLEDKKQDILEQLKTLPPEALSVAATAASVKDDKYATKTGKILTLSPSQEEAMMETGKVVIAAGAGSGKTKTLAGKVVYNVKELGLEPHQIMATSFTRKAAAELKERIEKYGVDLSDRVVQEGFGTTHSIATKLVLKYAPRMANFLKGYEQKDLLKMAIVQIQMSHIAGNSSPVKKDLFDTSTKGSNSEYKTAIENSIGYFTWMSKQTWVRNLAWVKDTLNILERAKNLDPKDLNPSQKQTINSIFNTVKGPNPPSFRLSSSQVVKTADGDSIYWTKPAGQWFNIDFKFDKGDENYSPGDFEMYISNMKGKLVSPTEAFALDPGSPFAAVYGAYEWLKSGDGEPIYAGKSDFDDVLLNATKILLNFHKARQEVQARYKCVLVDEAQDLNKSQHLFFGLIAGYVDPQTRKPREDGKMTAETYAFIGDDFQAIYEFRGAEPNEFINLSDAKGGNFKTKFLTMNYRSGVHIVNAANKLIAHNTQQIPKTCDANQARKGVGQIHAEQCGNTEEAAKKVAYEIEYSIKNTPTDSKYSDFGVALRSNAEAYTYCMELLKKGIPFRSSVNPLRDPSVRILLPWLKIANLGKNADANTLNQCVIDAMKGPKTYLGDAFKGKLVAMYKDTPGYKNYIQFLEQNWNTFYTPRTKAFANLKKFTENLLRISSLDTNRVNVVEEVLNLTDLDGAVLVTELMEIVKKDKDLIEDLKSQTDDQVSDDMIKEAAMAPIKPLLDIISSKNFGEAMEYIVQLENANEKLAPSDDEKKDAVTVGTIHSWKGLEVPTMYIPLVRGKFPRYGIDDEDLSSERRLAYVALTRAEDKCVLLDIPNPRPDTRFKEPAFNKFISESCIAYV